jgi:hypothetical protein
LERNTSSGGGGSGSLSSNNNTAFSLRTGILNGGVVSTGKKIKNPSSC